MSDSTREGSLSRAIDGHVIVGRGDTARIGGDSNLRRFGGVSQLGLAVAALLLAGLLLRLPGIDTPSVEQRENQSSILARGWYLGDGDELAPARQHVLAEVDTVLEPFEPPLLELAAAAFYRATDGERIWFPRLLSALAWIASGLFLALLARRVTSTVGVLTAVALFAVWPYPAWHSRKFMPDALMVGCLLAAVLVVVRYWERPSRARLAAAGGAAAVATAIKPGVAFLFVVSVYVALAIAHGRLRDEALSGRLPLFAAFAASLSLLYVVVGRMTAFVNPDSTTGRVTPDLVLTSGFWSGWWDMVSFLLRWPQPQPWLALVPLGVAAVGFALVPRGVPRAVLWGLAVGYAAFGIAVASYTATHPYYALPLIPVLALAIGVVVDAAHRRIPDRRLGAMLVAVLLVGVMSVAAQKVLATLTEPAPSRTIREYEEIGEVTGHTTRAIVVDPNLSHPMMYWGWIVGEEWELDYNASLPPWIDPDEKDFLIVFGNDQLSHAGLSAFARGRPIVTETQRYTVFDLR